jgi:hypothetical protein
MTRDVLRATAERELRELRRRVDRYRDGRKPLDVRGRIVIIVDDGFATGLTDLVYAITGEAFAAGERLSPTVARAARQVTDAILRDLTESRLDPVLILPRTLAPSEAPAPDGSSPGPHAHAAAAAGRMRRPR